MAETVAGVTRGDEGVCRRPACCCKAAKCVRSDLVRQRSEVLWRKERRPQSARNAMGEVRDEEREAQEGLACRSGAFARHLQEGTPFAEVAPGPEPI